MEKLWISLLAFGLGFCPVKVLADEFLYRVTVGQDTVTSQITISTLQDGWRVLTQTGSEYTEALIGPDGLTREWTLRNAETREHVTAVLKQNAIQVTSEIDGKSVKHSLDLEGKPWYQFVGLSAKNLISSNQDSRSFRIVNPADLGIVKLKLIKKEISDRNLAGRQRQVLHMELRSDNLLLQSLWKADYWFDADSGLYLRYEGINGGPGTPKTTVELIF